jgi:hypothetical protein
VNLWQHRTRDGRSLRAGLDFLVPFADGTKPWTLPQITPFRASALYVLLRKAAVVWKAPAYRTLADKVGGGTAREHLVIW